MDGLMGLGGLGQANTEPFQVARSLVVGPRTTSGARVPTMPSVLSRGVLEDYSRQAKAGRTSTRPDQYQYRKPTDLIEPPYDLSRLVSLLFDSPDFYAVVDQLSTDTTGLGWDLPDRELRFQPVEQPEAERIIDTEAAAQRAAAGPFLEGIATDFVGKPITIETLCKCSSTDKESTGQGYIEVASDEAAMQTLGLFHIATPFVRRRVDGSFAQIDDAGREVAYFRPFNSSPDAPTSRYTLEEARKVEGAEVGALKNELADFRHYHAAELHYGVPPIVSALAAVYGNIFSDSRNVRYFVNRALPDWLVEIRAQRSAFQNVQGKDFSMVDQYEQAIMEHMQYVLQGDDYRVLTLRLPTGEIETTWTKLNTDLKDQDFQVYQMRNRDIIIRVYRVLPHRLGIIEAASLGTGTGETQEQTYKNAQIDPRQQEFERFFQVILDRNGFHLVSLKFRELDVTDEAREMSLLQQADTTGVLSINELREWLSRIVKEQDFPPMDEDYATVPKYVLEQQAAGMLAAGMAPMLGGAQPQVASIDPEYANIFRVVHARMSDRIQRRREALAAAGRDTGVDAPSTVQPPIGALPANAGQEQLAA